MNLNRDLQNDIPNTSLIAYVYIFRVDVYKESNDLEANTEVKVSETEVFKCSNRRSLTRHTNVHINKVFPILFRLSHLMTSEYP